MLTLLLDKPTDDSVEVAVTMVKVCPRPGAGASNIRNNIHPVARKRGAGRGQGADGGFQKWVPERLLVVGKAVGTRCRDGVCGPLGADSSGWDGGGLSHRKGGEESLPPPQAHPWPSGAGGRSGSVQRSGQPLSPSKTQGTTAAESTGHQTFLPEKDWAPVTKPCKRDNQRVAYATGFEPTDVVKPRSWGRQECSEAAGLLRAPVEGNCRMLGFEPGTKCAGVRGSSLPTDRSLGGR